MIAPIAVLGSGSWGTALAIQFARAGKPTRLWGRDAVQRAAMRAARVNTRYLPEAPFPAGLATRMSAFSLESRWLRGAGQCARSLRLAAIFGLDDPSKAATFYSGPLRLSKDVRARRSRRSTGGRVWRRATPGIGVQWLVAGGAPLPATVSSVARKKATAILLISCPDRRGLVAAIANFLYRYDAEAIEAVMREEGLLQIQDARGKEGPSP